MKQHLVECEWTEVGPGRGDAAAPEQRARPSRTLTVNLAESPLRWLHARGHLSDRQLAAGELLRRDFEAAQLGPSITMRWEPVRVRGTGPGLDAGERHAAAHARFHAALATAGRGLQDVLWRVVCAGEGLPEAERAMGWPSRSGKLVLRFALDRVADFHRVPGG